MTPTAAHERPPLPLSAVGVAITAAVFVFGAWGYLTKADAFRAGWDLASFLKSTGAGYILMAALGGIMQAGAALGAMALRRAKDLNLGASWIMSGAMVCSGALFTAYTVHNALEATGMLDGGAALAVAAWIIAMAVPVFEFCVWWVNESLIGRAEDLKAADVAARLEALHNQGSRTDQRAPGAVSSIEWAALSNDALEAAISALASGMKFGVNERKRRQSALANAG